MDIPTKVRISVDRKSLYDIDLPSEDMVSLLDVLMRTYPGVFSFLQTIDEEYVSARIGTTVPGLRQLLYSMSLEHVISYVPAAHSDVVFLHHDRLRPGNVDLMPERYNMLRENYEARSRAMLEYASETDECRSRYLLRYFGQTDTVDCGTCDICREKSGSYSHGDSTAEMLIGFIRERDGSYRLEELMTEFGNPAKSYSKDYLDILRHLIDDGIVPPYQN